MLGLPFGGRNKDNAPSEVDRLTDEQIYELWKSKQKLSDELGVFGGHNIVRITSGTVMKASQDFEEDTSDLSEAFTLDLIFQHTTIPVPRVRRIVQQKYTSFFVMDYIPGRQLSEVWSTLSLSGKLRVVFTLRGYVQQMRAIRHPRSTVPGPVASGAGARMCFSPLFGQLISWRGPFASYEDLSAFFNDRQRLALESDTNTSSAAVPVQDPFDDSAPLVLTHQDLNMRNIIVGDDDRLWLVDWSWAGFYPPWFEFIAMKIQSQNEEVLTGKKEPFWDIMIPFICGPYYRQEKWYLRMERALNWY